jgi:hypothetical protein
MLSLLTNRSSGAVGDLAVSFPLVVTWGKLFKKHLFDDIGFPVGRVLEDEVTLQAVYKARQIGLRMLLLFYQQRVD